MTTIAEKFNHLPRNLRWCVLIVLLFLIAWLWWTLCCVPLSLKTQAASLQARDTEQIARDLQNDYNLYQRFLHAPASDVQERITLLQQQLKNMEQVPLLHRHVLHSANELQALLRAIAKAPADIEISQLQVNPESPKTNNQKTITLRFRGDYFSTMRYLAYLESLSWFLIFDQLEYTVKQYPTADVVMTMVPL